MEAGPSGEELRRQHDCSLQIVNGIGAGILGRKNLASLLKSLPALRNPTISGLSQKGWVAVETIIDEHVVRELIPRLKAAGAEGIIEYPLNKVVY